MNPPSKDFPERQLRKLPRALFPLIALPLYPMFVVIIANFIAAVFARPIAPLLPRLHTLLVFPIQLPWCLFTIGGVAGTMIFARLPYAGLVLAATHCIGGWLFFRTLQPSSGRGLEITDVFVMAATVAASLAYAITAPLLVAAYRRFFLPPSKPRVITPPDSTSGVYDY